jgi:predicted permease
VRSFSSIGLSAFDSFTLTGQGDATQLNGLRVDPGFFRTLGVAPLQGREFTAGDDVPNGPAVCIVSHELWQSQFGGQPLVGRTIDLNGAAWEVVGILPPQVSVPFRQVQVFAPRVFEVGFLTPAQVQAGATYAQAIARLKPGVTMEQARSELAAFSSSYTERHSARLDANNISEPRSYVATLVSGFEPTMYTLLAAASSVLLIACANVAALFLSRLLQRRKEVAVRLSLGSSRGLVIRQFLVESLVFSVLAGICGVLLAILALNALQSVLAAQLPPNTVLTLNWRALVFAGAAATVCSVLTGLIPALQASRPDVLEQLKDASRGSSSTHGQRFRKGLIVAEVTLSVVLLVASGLLLTSLVKLQRTELGFNPAGVAGAFIGLAPGRYATREQQLAFFDRVIAQLEAQPNIEAAAVALGVPLAGGVRTPYAVAGQPPPPPGQQPIANFNVVSDSYLRTLAIPIMAGRDFNSDDRLSSPPVAMINQTLAARLFPGRSAVGEALLLGAALRRVEIVGVTKDVRSAGVNAPIPDEITVPFAQSPRQGLNLIAKTTGDPTTLQNAIRSAVAAVDRTQAIAFFTTMESIVTLSLGAQRFVATLTGLFAALALLLSLTGLYSVLAYLVSQRTPEIGIRMALGATRRDVIALVMRSGLGLVLVGLVLGLAGAAAAGRLLRQQLFGVEPVSIGIYAGVAVVFTLVATVACLVPSLRASRIDPQAALRIG